jgi:L-ascorbate metabolism protein UlaG (beta-lactamase superfamily)
MHEAILTHPALVKNASVCYYWVAMEITFLGHSSFLIRGKETTVVTDPFDPKKTGFKFPKVSADIVTISHEHEDHNFVEGVSGEPFVISGPGEYEVKGVRIFGIPALHGGDFGKVTLYLIEMDDLSIVHLSDLGQKLEHDQVEELNSVDILMVPVGNAKVQLDAEKAAEVVAQLEPYIVLPMHYRESEETKKFGPVEKFLEQMGEENVRREKKLKVTKSSLPEDTEVVVLERVT